MTVARALCIAATFAGAAAASRRLQLRATSVCSTAANSASWCAARALENEAEIEPSSAAATPSCRGGGTPSATMSSTDGTYSASYCVDGDYSTSATFCKSNYESDAWIEIVTEQASGGTPINHVILYTDDSGKSDLDGTISVYVSSSSMAGSPDSSYLCFNATWTGLEDANELTSSSLSLGRTARRGSPL